MRSTTEDQAGTTLPPSAPVGRVAGRVGASTAAVATATVRCGTDRVARLGGDEFVVLIGAPQRGEEAESTARRVLDGLGPPVDVGDGLSVLASIGIAVVDPGTGSLDGSLIALADRAMYVATQAGGRTHAVADPLGDSPNP